MGTLSANKGYQIPTVGSDASPQWPNELNASLNIIDSNMGGVNSLSVAGSSNVTLTAVQAQSLIQQFTGALTGNITVFLPAVGSFYCIENATSGGFALSVGCTNGSGTLLIPQGLSTFVWTDGSAVRISSPPGWTEISTSVASGATTLPMALPAPFRRFRVTFQSLIAGVSGTQLCVLTSTNGGSSYGTSYDSNGTLARSGGAASVVVFGSNPQTSIVLTENMTTSNAWDGSFEVYPGTNTGQATVWGTSFGVTNAISPSNWSLVNFAGAAGAGTLQTNYIQFFMGAGSSGNLSGTFSGVFILEGLP